MANRVLGVESGEGKYLVFNQMGQDTSLFLAFNIAGIGGHKDMLSQLDNTTFAKKVHPSDLKTFARRPEIIRALEGVVAVRLSTPRLNFVDEANYSGGKYTFRDGILRLHDSSDDLGGPDLRTLHALEKNLLGYVNYQGDQIKEVRIE